VINTKESIFKKEIVPLMQEVVHLCMENKIALVASFGLDVLPDGNDRIHGSWILIGGDHAGSSRLNHAAGILLKARDENHKTEINLP
jgi:hypothetical protein